MKTSKLHKLTVATAMACLMGAAFTGCDDNFDYPPIIVPEATITPNTTIADLKAKYWSDDRNYADTIANSLEYGETMIIGGRVIANDETGNIYKSLIIQDETAALAISINNTSLSDSYKIGQQVVIDVTNLCIGKYNGLQQIGEAEWYASGNCWEVTFMSSDAFAEVAQVNGLPRVAMIDTIPMTIPDLKAINTPEGLQKYQSQLIRLDNVSWADGGLEPFAPTGSSATRNLVDAEGNTIGVRNSGYSDFASELLPTGTGSVVAIASYYGTSWQLMIRTLDDCIGFDDMSDVEPDPEIQPKGDGTEANPYNVVSALKLCENGEYTSDKVYVSGTVVKIDEIDPSYGNATYYIADEGSRKSLEIYRGYYLGGAKFTSTDQLKQGDVVTVYGELTLFYSTAEMKQGNYLTSLNGTTSGGGGSNNGGNDNNGSGSSSGDSNAKFELSGTHKFVKATSVTSGQYYILADAEGKVCIPIDQKYGDGGYGYLYVTQATVSGNTITTDGINAILFTEGGGGFTMLDCYQRYLGMTGNYTSFQLASTPKDGWYWTVSVAADSEATITNIAKNKYVGWNSQYSEFIPGGDGAKPYIYVLAD